ncbi:hypothetical protein Efla_005236 [Eimeria flavescens]
MSGVHLEVPTGLPAPSKDADTIFWQSLLAGMAIGQTLMALMYYIRLSQHPMPWGKFRSRANRLWGPAVPMWAAWLIQELPSALIPARRPFNLIVLLAFTAHYVHRVFIYPLRHYSCPQARLRDTVPLLIPVSAFIFCFVNGVAQSISGCHFDYSTELHALRHVFPRWFSVEDDGLEALRKVTLWDLLALLRFCVGLLLFLFGMTVNILSDEHLLQLKTRPAENTQQSLVTSPGSNEAFVTLRRSSRLAAKKDGDDIVTFKCHVQPHGSNACAYKIPRAGWFQVVSCANYWGEIVEWFGYAIMCNSAVSLSFALFTLMFLTCRGVQTHLWYKGRFGSRYPEDRYAVIPYIL